MHSLSSIRVPFSGRAFADTTVYRNQRTGVEYGIIPCFTGGYWLTRGVSLLSSVPMPRRDAVCLIELDAYSR